MEVGRARVALPVRVDMRLVDIDDDVGSLGHRQLVRDVGADAADAADDVMTIERRDLLEHFASPQDNVDLAGNQEHGHFGEDVIDDADAGRCDEHGEDAAGHAVRHVHDLGVADGRDRDEGHVEAVEDRVLGAADDAVADGPDRVREDQRGRRRGEGAVKGANDAVGHASRALRSRRAGARQG